VTGEGDPGDLVEAYTEMMLGESSRYSDGSVRRGSGELQVEKVEIFAAAETNPVKRFRTGDDVVIRLHFDAESPVPRPVFGIEIASLGGATVTAPCTRDAGLIPDVVDGRGYVDISLRGISLLPGTYDLHTSVTDFNRQHEFDVLHLAQRFDVMSGRPYESAGLVTLRPEWSMSSLEK
jgi:ABC-2 type transport system ATP-binding protein